MSEPRLNRPVYLEGTVMNYARHYLSLAATPRLREKMNWKAGAEYTRLQWKRVNSFVSSVDYHRLPLYRSENTRDVTSTPGPVSPRYLIGKSGQDCIMLSLINWLVAVCFGYLIPLYEGKEALVRLVDHRQNNKLFPSEH